MPHCKAQYGQCVATLVDRSTEESTELMGGCKPFIQYSGIARES
jgi:hypothetical protein